MVYELNSKGVQIKIRGQTLLQKSYKNKEKMTKLFRAIHNDTGNHP